MKIVDLQELDQQTMDFTLALRTKNIFDERLYDAIYKKLKILVEVWKLQDDIPKSAFLSCVYLMDFLAGGSRFYSEEVARKVEDAGICLMELFTQLEN